MAKSELWIKLSRQAENIERRIRFVCDVYKREKQAEELPRLYSAYAATRKALDIEERYNG